MRRLFLALPLLLLPVFAFAESLAGTYAAQGLNPDGSSYKGTVIVSEKGSTLKFSWKVGTSYEGTGFRDGRVVVIDWGGDAPVIYVTMPNGELHGTWASGRAVELLVPQK